MRVITLEKLREFVERKANHKQQIITFKQDSASEGAIIFMNDNCRVSVKGAMTIEEVEAMDNVNCVICFKDIEDLHSEHPFIKSREALSGVVKVCGTVPSEAELSPYFFTL